MVSKIREKVVKSFDWFIAFEVVALVVVVGLTLEFWNEIELAILLGYINAKNLTVQAMVNLGFPRIDIIAILFPV